MGDVNFDLILHRLNEISESQKTSLIQLAKMEQRLSKVDLLTETVSDIKDWKKDIQDTISQSELRELKMWKNNVMEVISPKQLDELLNDIEKLKTFKTQSTMIWIVVQGIITILLAISIFIK